MRQSWKKPEGETVREESRCSGLYCSLPCQKMMKINLACCSPMQLYSAITAAAAVVVDVVVVVDDAAVVVVDVVDAAAVVVDVVVDAAAVVVDVVVDAAAAVVDVVDAVVVVVVVVEGAAAVSAVVTKSLYCPVEMVEGCTGYHLQDQGAVCGYGRSDTQAAHDHNQELDLREECGPAYDSTGCTRGTP